MVIRRSFLFCIVRAAITAGTAQAIPLISGSYIDSVWVYLNPCDDCIEFPNAFTPVKGYGNELFRPLLKCPVNQFHIRIFNRWGNLVYESKDVYEGWNGRFNYEYAPMGTYVYMVEYTAKGKLIKQQIVGNVTLLR